MRALQSTERGRILEDLRRAQQARRRIPGWSAVVAAVMAVAGEYYIAAGCLGLGVISEVARQWKLSKTVQRLRRELRDPMDGS